MANVFRLLPLVLLPVVAIPAEVYVPDELQAWEEWVLDGHEYRECPFYFDRGASARGDFVCVWPGTLELDVTEEGGRFSQRVSVAAEESWLPLPGDENHWPDRVTLNGEPAIVVERSGAPAIAVGPGEYAVQGRFAWDERPARLRMPPASGLVELSVDGRRIARPEIDRSGIFLGESAPEAAERDTIDVVVHRLVTDAVPTRLTTRLSIDVSGSVREATLGPVLPDGFTPVSLSSALPVRLEPDGTLRLQVRPGRWQVSLVARAAEVLNAVTLDGGSLADTEIWSYRGNDRLRVTAAEGLPPVDPVRVNAPPEWQELPAFRVTSGDTLTIVERSRGQASAENTLTLDRDMWVDFDGGGFTVRDRVGGRMQTGWRLDMRMPFELASATEAGDNLLVTKGDEDGESGVEVRRANVDLEALARVEVRGTLPATGWLARFTEVSADLYLPPGHKLLAAPGADRAIGSWTANWQLLDFFLVLIITIAAWKLFGRGAGVIAVLALALSYNEPGAPAWLWLNLLVAVALLRVAPPGRLRLTVQGYLGASAVLLVLALVPFIGDQLRFALYPQLEPQAVAYYDAPGRAGTTMPVDADDSPATLAVQPSKVQSVEADEARRERPFGFAGTPALEEVVVTGSRLDTSQTNFARYAASAVVQTGPGIPSWQWNQYRLTWSGPVDAGQELRLVILPRWLVSVLRVLSVALLLLLAGVLLADVSGRRWRLPGGLTLGRGTAGLLLVAMLGTVTLSPRDALAEMPDAEILNELERRLTRTPECVPRCGELSSASVDAGDEAIRIVLDVVALEDIALPLPGSERGWRPDAVSASGSLPVRVVRAGNGALWLMVPEGRQRFVLSGSVAGVDSVEIPFPTPPRTVDVSADGWVVAGIKDRRLLSGSIELNRLRSDESGDSAARWESSRFPPFVAIGRSIEIGRDWRVNTTVTRIAPTEGALSLEIPLLDGETVISEDVDIVDGNLRVTMGPDQSSVRWTSNLPERSPIELAAAGGAPWTETWYVGVGSIWHVEFGGVPESGAGNGRANIRTAEFHPRGGESLTIVATRPEAVSGATLAFDAVELATEQGMRTASAVLTLDYRSTRGDEHVIRLPVEADVTRVLLDGEQRALRAANGELSVPILPGKHNIRIEWREDLPVSAIAPTPAVDIGAPAGNVSLDMALPENRWLLVTSGPALGPAVLYWSELAVLVVFALLLGRIPWTPLKARHWLLLGLGFSTFNWPVMALVIVWLLAVGARDHWRTALSWWRYNLVQAGIVAVTVIALAAIVASLPQGLLGTPDMHVTGNDSWGNRLSWFADRSESALPTALAVSVPMWIYKVLILAWSLWLSLALLRWLPWTWQVFARDGFFKPRQSAEPGAPGSGAA